MSVASPEIAFRSALVRAVASALDIEIRPDEVPLTYPPSAAQGDIASPICFELAKRARKAPRKIADAIVAELRSEGGLRRVEAAGPGYVNAFLDRDGFLGALLTEGLRATSPAPKGKVIVEHTNINPNKAAHIGHLRNAVLGDTLVRFSRFLGREVEVQNYIDDTGVQVADLVVGFLVLRGEDIDAVRERYAEERLRGEGLRFDYVAWDLYAEVTRFYAEDASRLSHRTETLQAMEEGDNPIAELADFVAMRMVRHHLDTMLRLGVRYDVLPRESDILRLRFWDDAFRLLKDSGAIHRVDDGKNAGCWVMNLEGAEAGAGEDQKVIVRSNGVVTYVGKDIAYQMWKFGLLDRDFHYRRFGWPSGEEAYAVWSTTSEPGDPDAPPFGGGHVVYNVIDTRQSYLQRVVAQGLRALGHDDAAERSVHFAYDMVALTPSAVEALFPDFELSDADRSRPHIEMSGRKGLGVRADDLVDALIERATREVRARNATMDDARVAETARRIAVGALRYYMLRFTRNRVVAFDLDAALAFEGETGPYLQYSVVRAKNILAKADARFGADATAAERLASEASLEALGDDAVAGHWELALRLLRVETTVRSAVDGLELSLVAKHAYALAQEFNGFYHRHPVVQEDDDAVRAIRLAIVRLYHDGMTRLLGLMGIEVPDRM